MDPDLPGVNAWLNHVKKHPEYTAKLQEVYHGLPYSFQGRVNNFSPRFRIDCERLRIGGMAIGNIAKALGVSPSSVRSVLGDFDEKIGLAKPPDWGREDFEAILNRILAKRRSLNDVCQDPDLPSKDAWVSYLKKHPEYAVKLREAYHSLPYSFQGRVNAFSPSFRVDCERLRAGGMDKKSIANKLGVCVITVRRVLKGFDEKMNLVITPSRKWGREDFEAVLERVREQRRSLRDVLMDPDLPNKIAWFRYVKIHPDFATKLQSIYHGMPYSYQAKVQNLSPRFQVDCQRHRASGMTIKDIAETLGVSRFLVMQALRGFDKRRLKKDRKSKKDE